MSHFAVLVIGDDVEKQLAPYQENNMGDCPAEYLRFNDETDGLLEQYQNGTTKTVVSPSGELLSPYEDRFLNPDYKTFSEDESNPRWIYPTGYEIKEVPFNRRYSSFDEFVTQYHGYEEKDPSTGRYGYWENPDAKWDWWTIGGRYQGRLQTRWGETVDQARAAELDWESMRAKRLADRERWWNEFQAAVKKDPANEGFHRYEYGVDADDTRESYIRKGEEFSVFAILKNGQWYEKGEMGWWGIVKDEKDQKDWQKTLKELLSDIKPDDLLTIVDCHI